jgi:hypothetical protein
MNQTTKGRGVRKSIFTEILIGILAFSVAAVVIVNLLKDTGSWTGFEQENIKSVTGTQNTSFMFVAAPVAVKGVKPKTAAGKEFTKFGITPQMFLEAHWWGMEVENITPMAMKILKIPPGIKGLWIDETNLWAVRSGIKGADILLRVNGIPVGNLGEFYQLTKRFRNRRKVKLDLLRGSKHLSAVLAPGPPLGIAAMESADALDPMTSDAAVDPLDLIEEAPPDFPQRGYKALANPKR